MLLKSIMESDIDLGGNKSLNIESIDSPMDAECYQLVEQLALRSQNLEYFTLEDVNGQNEGQESAHIDVLKNVLSK